MAGKEHMQDLAVLDSSVRRALAFKLRVTEFKSQSGIVGGPVTIITWKASIELNLVLLIVDKGPYFWGGSTLPNFQ